MYSYHTAVLCCSMKSKAESEKLMIFSERLDFSMHKQNSSHLHCAGVEAEISDRDISKPWVNGPFKESNEAS